MGNSKAALWNSLPFAFRPVAGRRFGPTSGRRPDLRFAGATASDCRRALRRSGAWAFALAAAVWLSACGGSEPAEPPGVTLERQPLAAQIRRLAEALDFAGEPLDPAERVAMEEALRIKDATELDRAVAGVLAPRTPFVLAIDSAGLSEFRFGSAPGDAGERAALIERGWRLFFVRVENRSGSTGRLRVSSPQGGLPFGGLHPFYDEGVGAAANVPPEEAARRRLEIDFANERPLLERLSGLPVEYRLLRVYTDAPGPALDAELAFELDEISGRVSRVATPPFRFRVAPTREIPLRVLDADGAPTTAGIVAKDELGRVYPLPSKRLAPDFFFHDQVYRADGETLRLPAGRTYSIRATRGPEYLPLHFEVAVGAETPERIEIRLERWIDPAARGWYSGDHHIHAAGCLHYASPTDGVDPPVVMRQLRGEGLNVGCVLTWGMGWSRQRAFFRGGTDPLSDPMTAMRYDVETSGFPSSPLGHLTLLGLADDDFPGAERIEDWPSWNLPVCEWAKSTGAVVGQAHAGWGLDGGTKDLPNYAVPAMDGIGAQEFLVDAALGAVDFVGTHNSPYPWALNVWYHALNCGVRTTIAGETDFPCIVGDRVGEGRTYVRLGEEGPVASVDHAEWLAGLKAGRSYASDGRSHFFEFSVRSGDAVVRPGDAGGGELRMEGPGEAVVACEAAALLPEEPERARPRGIRPRPFQGAESGAAREDAPDGSRDSGIPIAELPYDSIPYWHLERARIPGTREVLLEIVANGETVASARLPADGRARRFEFPIALERSSWLAARILPSSHGNPVYAVVGGRPIRASKESAEWCVRAIDKAWAEKSQFIRESERAAAAGAFERARAYYGAAALEAEAGAGAAGR